MVTNDVSAQTTTIPPLTPAESALVMNITSYQHITTGQVREYLQWARARAAMLDLDGQIEHAWQRTLGDMVKGDVEQALADANA